jgi:hypothetical protein
MYCRLNNLMIAAAAIEQGYALLTSNLRLPKTPWTKPAFQLDKLKSTIYL